MEPCGLPNLLWNLEQSLRPIKAVVPWVSTPLSLCLIPNFFFLVDDEEAGDDLEAARILSGRIWNNFHFYLEPNSLKGISGSFHQDVLV